jgi:hypothetical protein
MARLLAVAFHESISRQRFDELFASPHNQLFAVTSAAHCGTCGTQFAVFFPASDDPDNGKCLANIEYLITKDCKAGEHSPEIRYMWGRVQDPTRA